MQPLHNTTHHYYLHYRSWLGGIKKRHQLGQPQSKQLNFYFPHTSVHDVKRLYVTQLFVLFLFRSVLIGRICDPIHKQFKVWNPFVLRRLWQDLLTKYASNMLKRTRKNEKKFCANLYLHQLWRYASELCVYSSLATTSYKSETITVPRLHWLGVFMEEEWHPVTGWRWSNLWVI